MARSFSSDASPPLQTQHTASRASGHKCSGAIRRSCGAGLLGIAASARLDLFADGMLASSSESPSVWPLRAWAVLLTSLPRCNSRCLSAAATAAAAEARVVRAPKLPALAPPRAGVDGTGVGGTLELPLGASLRGLGVGLAFASALAWPLALALAFGPVECAAACTCEAAKPAALSGGRPDAFADGDAAFAASVLFCSGASGFFTVVGAEGADFVVSAPCITAEISIGSLFTRGAVGAAAGGAVTTAWTEVGCSFLMITGLVATAAGPVISGCPGAASCLGGGTDAEDPEPAKGSALNCGAGTSVNSVDHLASSASTARGSSGTHSALSSQSRSSHAASKSFLSPFAPDTTCFFACALRQRTKAESSMRETSTYVRCNSCGRLEKAALAPRPCTMAKRSRTSAVTSTPWLDASATLSSRSSSKTRQGRLIVGGTINVSQFGVAIGAKATAMMSAWRGVATRACLKGPDSSGA
mmetsp:Transcript_97227/g.279892  ORF Transcript_97227/g.279892 Transcript_97227/m.279892 type:complete len:472 (-) Transcript_97227:3-1418(-)